MSISRRAILVVGLLVVLSGCVTVGPVDDDPDPDDPDPDALFESIFVYDDSLVDVSGERTTTVSNGTTTFTEREQFVERPYTHQRTEILESVIDGREGDRYVSNATTNWWYYPDENYAEVFRVAAAEDGTTGFDSEQVREARAERAAEALANYSVSYEGTTTVAGREAHEISAEIEDEAVESGVSVLVGDTEFVYALETVDPSADADVVEQRAWIDAEYGYPLKEQWVTEDPDGERWTHTTAFETVAFNEAVSEDTFAFSPPENVTVRDLSVEE